MGQEFGGAVVTGRQDGGLGQIYDDSAQVSLRSAHKTARLVLIEKNVHVMTCVHLDANLVVLCNTGYAFKRQPAHMHLGRNGV